MSIKKINALNDCIAKLVRQRNIVLAEVRRNCKHLRLVELNYRSGWLGTSPPRRICERCGAEEEGWGCGYQVLVTREDFKVDPNKKKRGLVERTSDSDKFYSYRQRGPLYLVGQSHPNFAGGGVKTYEQLTEIAA